MVKVLFLVDDDFDDREIFQEAVMECRPDIQLLFAADGLEALKILHSGDTHPDVIFLDYNMPRMNGVDCLKQLKLDARTKSIPTVMYTTSGDQQQEKHVLHLGADYYMQKTNTFTQLCEELGRLITAIEQKLQHTSMAKKRA